jgi:hypothetical protein
MNVTPVLWVCQTSTLPSHVICSKLATPVSAGEYYVGGLGAWGGGAWGLGGGD